MLTALLVVLGFFAGLLGALTGIGGGILLTPILALHFGVPIRQAIGTSLVAVITTSAASSSVLCRCAQENACQKTTHGSMRRK